MNRRALHAYAALTLTMVFWASNALVGREMRGSMPPFTLALGRWVVALAILIPFAAPRIIAQWREIRCHWRAILFLGLVGVAAFNGFLYSGLQYTTATNGLLLQATIPALVVLISSTVFDDRPLPSQLLGVGLSTIGVLVIVFRGDVATALALKLRAGDILILGGCLAWAIYTACLRLRPSIEPIAFLFLTFCIGAVAMAPFSAAEFITRTSRFGSRELIAIVYLGTFPSVVAYFLYNSAVDRLGAGAAGQAISLMPVFGALLATAILGEQLHKYHGFGIAAILSGIALTLITSKAAHDPRQPGRAGGEDRIQS